MFPPPSVSESRLGISKLSCFLTGVHPVVELIGVECYTLWNVL